MNLNDNKKEWEGYLEVKGLSPRTIEEYNSYFDKFNYDKIDQSTIIPFLQKHNNIVARAFLKNLIVFLKMQGHDIQIELLSMIPKITGRKKKRIPDILKDNQVIELADNMKNERSELMLLISFYGGLRISELVGDEYAITPYSFNWNVWVKDPSKNGSLKIIGKGNKQRNVFMPQRIMARLYQYIKSEVSQKQSKEDKLFSIGERRWKKILSDESLRTLGRHINPHLLRHSCNQWLRTNGWDVTERQRYMGHENPATTMIYDHTTQEDLKDKFNQLF